MALVEVAPSDEMRVILCLKFDRRAPFDAVANLKRDLMDCACVVHSVEASGAFDYMIEAALSDFMAYQALIERFAHPLARLVERQETSFVCRRFLRTLDRASAMWVPCRDGRRRIDCAKIDRVSAEGDYVRLHVGAADWLLHDTMHHIRDLLDRDEFLTLHRSTIVNVGFIDELRHRGHYWVALLRDGTEQRIAKSHVVAILGALRTDSSILRDGSAMHGRSTELSERSVEAAMNPPPICAI